MQKMSDNIKIIDNIQIFMYMAIETDAIESLLYIIL